MRLHRGFNGRIGVGLACNCHFHHRFPELDDRRYHMTLALAVYETRLFYVYEF